MKLPILLSVPHAGWRIPPEVEDICILSQKDLLEDGDVGADEIIKTHTCWNVPVYREAPSDELIENLLQKYYHPYHERLISLSRSVKVGIDAPNHGSIPWLSAWRMA